MSMEIFAAYLATTTLVLVIPGPTVMLVVSYALSQGRRAAWGLVLGVVLGDTTAMVLSLAGLGVLVKASAGVFLVLKGLGAAYLIWLGIKMWRQGTEFHQETLSGRSGSNWKMMGHAWAVTATNPKGITFFIAFLPQFVNQGAPIFPQLALLGGAFLVLAAINALGYALLAGSVHHWVQRPGLMKALNRIGGSALIGAGVMTAAVRRSS